MDFWEHEGVEPVLYHENCRIDFTYLFNMNRFRMLDHSLLSATAFDTADKSACAIHDVDNTSDHKPIALVLQLQTHHLRTRENSYIRSVLRGQIRHLNSIDVIIDAH